ncbi:MAG: FHA domain-containing protein [Aridibacter sp.]
MHMIKCQTCGSENLESSQFCDECGDDLNKYQAPEVSNDDLVQPTQINLQNKEVPIFQAANVTSVGIPAIVDENESEDEETSDLYENEDEHIKNLKQRGVHAVLIIERGASIGTEFPISADESTIGRWDADNGVFPDVDLDAFDPEAKVSRKHARIILKNGIYMLEDLGSTNGTFVNRGRRLIPGNPHRLQDGDEIIVGKTFLRFGIEQ